MKENLWLTLVTCLAYCDHRSRDPVQEGGSALGLHPHPGLHRAPRITSASFNNGRSLLPLAFINRFFMATTVRSSFRMRGGSREAFEFERLETHHILANLPRRAQHEFLLAGGDDVQHPDFARSILIPVERLRRFHLDFLIA